MCAFERSEKGMEFKMKINKKEKIVIIISVLIIIIALTGIIAYVANKPKIELNKAISYILGNCETK